jgi:hypothetical protein
MSATLAGAPPTTRGPVNLGNEMTVAPKRRDWHRLALRQLRSVREAVALHLTEHDRPPALVVRAAAHPRAEVEHFALGPTLTVTSIAGE